MEYISCYLSLSFTVCDETNSGNRNNAGAMISFFIEWEFDERKHKTKSYLLIQTITFPYLCCYRPAGYFASGFSCVGINYYPVFRNDS